MPDSWTRLWPSLQNKCLEHLPVRLRPFTGAFQSKQEGHCWPQQELDSDEMLHQTQFSTDFSRDNKLLQTFAEWRLSLVAPLTSPSCSNNINKANYLRLADYPSQDSRVFLFLHERKYFLVCKVWSGKRNSSFSLINIVAICICTFFHSFRHTNYQEYLVQGISSDSSQFCLPLPSLPK